MSKLSKAQAKAHREALALIAESKSRRLTLDEREHILENFHEGAEHMNGLAGAFFTPAGLARDFSIEVFECERVVDLCAGIGALAFACRDHAKHIVCVERNGAYIEAGRAVMPDATWIHASVFDTAAYAHLGPFDIAISNPPFGTIKADGFEGAYTGGLFDLRVVEAASRVARHGVFILPQMSTPFRYSGRERFEEQEDERVRKFREQTGIAMEMNCGIDTAAYLSEWKGVSPICEIVTCSFEREQATPVVANPAAREQLSLLDEVA